MEWSTSPVHKTSIELPDGVGPGGSPVRIVHVGGAAGPIKTTGGTQHAASSPTDDGNVHVTTDGTSVVGRCRLTSD